MGGLWALVRWLISALLAKNFSPQTLQVVVNSLFYLLTCMSLWQGGGQPSPLSPCPAGCPACGEDCSTRDHLAAHSGTTHRSSIERQGGYTSRLEDQETESLKYVTQCSNCGKSAQATIHLQLAKTEEKIMDTWIMLFKSKFSITVK